MPWDSGAEQRHGNRLVMARRGTTPETGDVILLSGGSGPEYPQSELVQRATKSPYSHAIVVLEPGRYADVDPGPEGSAAIRVFDRQTLDRIRDQVVQLDLLRPTGPVADRRQLIAAVEARRAEAPPALPGGQRLSTETALIGLALIGEIRTWLDRPVPDRRQGRRLESALWWALDDADRRLFGSEFVHRVLDEAGQWVEPPATQLVALAGSCRPTYQGERLDEWLDVVRTWLLQAWRLQIAVLELDCDARATFDELWERVREAYQSGRGPERLEPAHFCAPAHFAASASLEWVALNNASTRRWTRTPWRDWLAEIAFRAAPPE